MVLARDVAQQGIGIEITVLPGRSPGLFLFTLLHVVIRRAAEQVGREIPDIAGDRAQLRQATATRHPGI